MGDQQNGLFPAFVSHRLEDDALVQAVEVGGRLVQQEEGRIVEMMAGTFIITGFDYETGEDMSLTDEQADYWEHRFHNPEILVSDGEGGGVVLPIVLA